MATNRADFITDEDRELLLQRYLDIEWCDDVTHLRCVRCQRVAISHYVSNCQHLFCRNCRTIFSDGGQWKCPQCHEYVTQLNDQGIDIEMEFIKLRICCPNKKYGCQHVDQVKKIVNHMRVCENTREAALPMEYTGENTTDLLYRHVSGLSEQLRQMSDEMRVMKSESDANWKQMQVKMNELEQKVDNNADLHNRELTGFQSSLHIQTEKLIEFEMKIEGGDSDKKMGPILEEMRDEIEKMKSEQTRLAIKSKDDLETIYTIKGRLIELVEQNDDKLKKKLDKHDINSNKLMANLNTRMAEIMTKQEMDHEAMEKLNNTIIVLNKDLQKQHEKLDTLEQHGKDERNREREQLEAIMERMKQSEIFIRAELTARDAILKECQEKIDEMGRKNETESVQRKMEEMKARMHDDGDDISLEMSLKAAEMKAVPALPVDLNRITQVNTEIFEWNFTVRRENDLNITRTTDELRLPGYPFGLQVQLCAFIGGRMGVSHRLIDIYNTKQITVQSMPKIIYIIQDQYARSWDKKKDIIRYCDYGFARKLVYDNFDGTWILAVNSQLLNAPHNKNGSIKIKILIEPPSIANSLASNDGVLYWRVDNYSERKRMEEEGLVRYQESPYFYTAPQGYRAEAAISLNTMTASIEMYKGKYDDKLTGHPKHRIAITLFNQKHPSMNLAKSYECKSLSGQSIEICKPSEVEKGGFVTEDSILLKLVIEPLKS